MNVVQHDGRRSSLWACIVAQCKDGRITRIDEYLDSSKFRRPREERLVTDGEIRELCNRFFDAYEDRRVDELAEIYAPDCIVWHNVFGRETTGAENLAALPEELHRSSAGAPTTTARSTSSTAAS